MGAKQIYSRQQDMGDGKHEQSVKWRRTSRETTGTRNREGYAGDDLYSPLDNVK
jgi:hypothetical protein